MRITVMKFGGTSVADPEKIQRAAERAVAERRKGRGVVVVVSAPGQMTDELLTLAERVAPRPDERELDQLLSTGEQVGISLFSMACLARGAAAVSMTGAQAGVEAQGPHTRAQIVRIRPANILRELHAGRIVTVAGFQGLNDAGAVATLGRGGSDLTAVALASALKTGSCEIFSDVKGVYTADPRIVFEARKLTRLGFEEMLELAGAGSQVMQARSLEVAASHGVSIHVRSAFHREPGTWIVPKENNTMLEKARVSALALDKNEVRLSIVDVPDRPGVAAEVLSVLAKRDIPVDMIIQSAPTHRGVNDISFMTPRAWASKAREALASAAKELNARVDLHEHVAKISAVGTGFRHHPWVAARMFETLAKNKINIHMIVASDLRISCVVDAKHGETALRALHRAYGLGKSR
ncbi:MAG: aspartate kinase [Elusimicrobia bacterium]|nr:aspartate kinase [Elusimicrobiota bacterium]